MISELEYATLGCLGDHGAGCRNTLVKVALGLTLSTLNEDGEKHSENIRR